MSEGHYIKVQLCCLNLERGGLELHGIFQPK